jgi:hypothetical protein
MKCKIVSFLTNTVKCFIIVYFSLPYTKCDLFGGANHSIIVVNYHLFSADTVSKLPTVNLSNKCVSVNSTVHFKNRV